MALPDSGGAFPPAPYDLAYREHHIHNAWYVGDSSELQSIYSSNGATRSPVTSSGLFARLQKYFWGRNSAQAVNKLHVPAPADVSRTMADLLFSQQPVASVPEEFTGDRKKIQARMDLLFNGDDTAATYLEAAEVCSALGGTYMRLWWDRTVDEQVHMDAVNCDAAVPTWRYNRLAGVTFWTKVLDDNGIVLRHLERHEPGRILHGLYQGDSGSLGRVIPLTEVEATAWAAEVSGGTGIIETGIDNALTASYIPNVRPNRKWRKTPGLTLLGRSDYEGLESLFDALDEAYTSWMRDIDHGKSRLVVDEGLLMPSQRGGGADFDSEQALFTPLREQLGSGASSAASQVQAIQFDIRWQEHSQTCAELLNAILRGAGLSTNNFSDSSLTVGVPTATEVNSKNSLSERTRNKKIAYWKQGLRPLMATAMKIDRALFDSGVDLGDELPDLRFPTRSSQSPVELAQALSLLSTARAISTQQMVIEQHPNWSKEEIAAEVQLIEDQKEAEMAPLLEPDEDPDTDSDQFGDDTPTDEDEDDAEKPAADNPFGKKKPEQGEEKKPPVAA